MSDILRIIQERQSVRGPFDPNHPIAQQDLEQILEAAAISVPGPAEGRFEASGTISEKQLISVGTPGGKRVYTRNRRRSKKLRRLSR